MGYQKWLPYDVRYNGPESSARSKHREFYWFVYEKDEYECPDCGRGLDDVDDFDVHHIDRNPLNGHLWNLIAVCERCHSFRHHGDEFDVSNYTLEEWKRAFVDPDYHPIHSD